MEETKEEDKEVKEVKRVDEILDIGKRIYDQNLRTYDLEKQRNQLINENKAIKDQANTKVR